MAACQVSIKFTYNPDFEAAHMPGNMVETLLDHSKACFHIYSYLCLLADKNENHQDTLGCIIKINTKKISRALGMKLRTVQQCFKDMFQSNLLIENKKYMNKNNDKDIYINGYKEMYKEKNYIKFPEEVFTQQFFDTDKGTISLFIQQFVSIYKNVLAQFQKEKNTNKNAQNFELIHQMNVERAFNEKTLLSKIKRVSKKDLESSLEKVKQFGMNIIESISKNTSEKKFIVQAGNIISKMFKPKDEHLSIIKKYPTTFTKVYQILDYLDLGHTFRYRKEREDLTQMCLQYGELKLMYGLLAYTNTSNNEDITEKCAYVRTCIENNFNTQNEVQ